MAYCCILWLWWLIVAYGGLWCRSVAYGGLWWRIVAYGGLWCRIVAYDGLWLIVTMAAVGLTASAETTLRVILQAGVFDMR